MEWSNATSRKGLGGMNETEGAKIICQTREVGEQSPVLDSKVMYYV